jgi:hypothetical protein
MSRTRLLVGLTAALGLVGRSVAADDAFAPRPSDVPSVFFIARSANKNQVHYGVRLDAACNPVGSQPVFGYWRMLERQDSIEPILPMEEPAYGLYDKQEIHKNPRSTTIRVALRSFRERPLVVSIVRGESGCEASATTTIAGTEALLHFIYVKIKWPFGVDHLLVRGTTRDGRRVEETIQN